MPKNLKAIRSWFDLGNRQQIHLMAGRTEPIIHDCNASHIALFIRNIADAETYLKASRITFHRQVRFDGVVQLYFSDPDGYLWELNEGKVAKAY